MRMMAVFLATAFLVAAGSASACPMATAGKEQKEKVAASTKATPIPSRIGQDNNS